MSKISNLIFGGKSHYITSPYGKRTVIKTSAGNTSSVHRGTDYGTNGKKIPQYAIEEGTILSCGKAKDGALFVWVKYPRIGKKFLHYHLDTISVKTGQAVKKGTKLGVTGKTGKATGVHLHLGVKDLKTGEYEDPEKLVYTAPVVVSKSATPTTPTKPKCKPAKSYYPKYTGKSTRIDDVFKAIGVPTSYRNNWSKRKPVATANGISGYVGSATQNTKLISLAKQGLLVKP